MHLIYQIDKMEIIRRSTFSIVFLILWASIQFSCKKLVDIPPPPSGISGANVYSSDATALAAVTGMYASMSKQGFATGLSSISYFSGLSADEFTLFSGFSNTTANYNYYRNQLSAQTPAFGSDFWNMYNYVFTCNAAIEGLTASTTINTAVKIQLLGEAKFMRGFIYFYLTNFFGDVPMVLSSDYRLSSLQPRTPKTQVYQQIISDLTEAKDLLADGYVKADGFSIYTSQEERVRPNKYVAAALLARVYLYTGDYAKAEEQATAVINKMSYYNLVNLNAATYVFQKNSKEAIWQIQPTATGKNTEDASLFLLPSTGPGTSFPVCLSNSLLSSFEPGDQRRYNRNFIDSVKVGTAPNPVITYYFPYKYRVNLNGNITSASGTTNTSEYIMVLRLAEQFLIRAEARAQQGNISGAQIDLNMIRSRAGLPNTLANDKPSLLSAVAQENRVEFFSEWGHRWLDLKRTGAVDAVMSIATSVKSLGAVNWSTTQQLYPIPMNDILYNPNLIQNAGY